MLNVWRQSVCMIAAAASLTAADPVWKSKPAAQWTEEDAKQILTASPWAKQVRAVVTRRPTKEQLREGGQMGQPGGVGNEGVDPKGSGPTVSPNVFSGAGGDDRSPRSLPQPIALKLRWESALPVQIAELKSRVVEPPTLEGDGYRIAVYGVPGAGFKGEPNELGKPLKNLAALKRDGKKDVRPVSAEVFPWEDGVVVVYVFPLSTEVSRKDGQVRFEAQIGRIVVAQTFELSENGIHGQAGTLTLRPAAVTSYSPAVFTSQIAGRRERHQYRRRLWNGLRIGMEAALPAGLALAGVAVSTWLAFRVGQSFAFTGFLHIVLVVLAAMHGGFWQATLTSVVAAACLNYFFVPPIYSFVNSPANWVALGAFEFTALIISRLSLRARVYKLPRSLR